MKLRRVVVTRDPCTVPFCFMPLRDSRCCIHISRDAWLGFVTCSNRMGLNVTLLRFQNLGLRRPCSFPLFLCWKPHCHALQDPGPASRQGRTRASRGTADPNCQASEWRHPGPSASPHIQDDQEHVSDPGPDQH